MIHILWRITPPGFLRCIEVFSLRRGDKSVAKYYSQFRGMMDELNQYLLTTDLETAKRQRDELYVCKLLFELSTTV